MRSHFVFSELSTAGAWRRPACDASAGTKEFGIDGRGEDEFAHEDLFQSIALAKFQVLHGAGSRQVEKRKAKSISHSLVTRAIACVWQSSAPAGRPFSL